ncbi:hypothetical protein [Candidatus Poriferisodalis sp.]|uniref:hypothetical protein n=1 Tax=Candidatus Poriferisodalis sp. TaxID=3101277 RepID=UPI003B5AD57E
MIGHDFWCDVPPLDADAYLTHITLDSVVSESTSARDCEVELLCLWLKMATGYNPFPSRLNARRNVLGDWSDDNGPFTDAEVNRFRETALGMFRSDPMRASAEADLRGVKALGRWLVGR